MRILTSAALAAALLAATAGAVVAESKPITMMRDAREMIPSALLGVWKVDQAASRPSRPGVTQLRSFSLTEEGKLMVAFITVNANGTQSLGHWWLQVDGVTPGFEFRSDNGSTPIAVLRLRKADEFTFDLSNSVAGVEASTAQYKLSPDGKMLTLTRSPGSPSAQTIVYRKWDGR